MIHEYEKKQFIEKVSENCSLFKATKHNKSYFMYEYTQMDMSDEYNFKVLKKLITCSHVLAVIDKFETNHSTYFITDYVNSNLLKQQLKQPHQIFQLNKALSIFANLVQIIEDLHEQNIIYRNLRLETIGYEKDQLYLSDFRFSQIVKRRERYFEVVGTANYMAPEFFMEDGYGYEVDVWAAGVCLYYMVTGSYPFGLEGKNQEEMVKQIQSKCKKGFNFVENASKCKKAKYIQSSKYLDELFERLFEIDYCKRITVQQLKAHPAIRQYLKEGPMIDLGSQMMSVIAEEEYNYGSIFMSMLSNFHSHHEFHKQQIVLDFMEHSSEILSLNSPNIITQQLKTLVTFSILKVATFKVHHLINVLSGMKEPQFKIDSKEWQEMKNTAGFKKIRQKLEKKKKIISMLFRAAFLNVQKIKQPSSFYNEQIPEDFAAIKQYLFCYQSQYRLNLSKMFELQKQMMKKQKKEGARKTCENLARLSILCMINRVFQEQNIKESFKWYYQWARKQSLQNLEEWIENQKMSNLKQFIKHVTTTKYVD